MSNTHTLPTDPADCDGTVVAPGLPCATFNLAVQGVDARIFRITQEMTKNVSSRVTGFSEDDKKRIDASYSELLAFIDLAGGSVSDIHGLIKWPLSDLQSVQVPVENETVNSALSYLMAGDYNLRVCQSARLNDGLLSSDVEDLVKIVAKSHSIITGFYDTFNPMDMPQSNPRAPVVEPASV